MCPIHRRKRPCDHSRVLVRRELVVAILQGTRTVGSQPQGYQSQQTVGHHRVNGSASLFLSRSLVRKTCVGLPAPHTGANPRILYQPASA